jgi:hypothetical protein
MIIILIVSIGRDREEEKENPNDYLLRIIILLLFLKEGKNKQQKVNSVVRGHTMLLPILYLFFLVILEIDLFLGESCSKNRQTM